MGLLDGIFKTRLGATLASVLLARGEGNRAIADTTGYGSNGDGANTQMYWDDTSVDPDDRVTTYAVNGIAVGRWKRNFAGHYNAKWGGAVADGVVDDTAAIQRVLDVVPDGEELHFPKGQYKITGKLTRSKSIKISGVGPQSKVIRSGAQTAAAAFIGLDIHGAANAYLDFVEVRHLSFDGADNGSVAYNDTIDSGTRQNDDLKISFVDKAMVERCQFANPRYRCLVVTTCNDARVVRCDFLNGPLSNGSNSITTAFYVGVFSCKSAHVEGCTGEADVTYVPGDQATAMGAPTYVVATQCEDITLIGNTGRNTANFEIYEACRNITLIGNTMVGCHMPPYKVTNFQRLTVKGNTSQDPVSTWGYDLLGSCYTRVTSYGCLRPNQGVIIAEGNTFRGSKSQYAAMYFQGYIPSSGDFDARIVYQNVHPGSFPGDGVTNRVQLCSAWSNLTTYTKGMIVTDGSGHIWESLQNANINRALPAVSVSDSWWKWRGAGSAATYYYQDFDTALYALTGQDYFNVRSVSCVGNTIDSFATVGIRLYCVAHASMVGNVLTDAMSLDTASAFTKAGFYLENFGRVSMSGNKCSMLDGALPLVNGVSTSIGTNGVIAWATNSAFAQVSRLAIDGGNDFWLNKATAIVDVQDLAVARCTSNIIGIQSFLNVNSVPFRSRGLNLYGVVALNSYYVQDQGTVPSASTEYSAFQANFLELRNEDDRFATPVSRRVVSSAADFTSKNQVSAGKYSQGSQVVVGGNQWKQYYRIETAGFWAPDYDAGTTYSIGNKVKSGGEFFVSLVGSNLNHTPTAGASMVPANSNDGKWKWLGNTELTYLTYNL
jgi:hypothetical protein